MFTQFTLLMVGGLSETMQSYTSIPLVVLVKPSCFVREALRVVQQWIIGLGLVWLRRGSDGVVGGRLTHLLCAGQHLIP